MLLSGQWGQDSEFEPARLCLQLGTIFRGEVKPGQGEFEGYWVASLNGRQIGAHRDVEWAKGAVEWRICQDMANARGALRLLEARAPTGADLFPHGAWTRFKRARQEAGATVSQDRPA